MHTSPRPPGGAGPLAPPALGAERATPPPPAPAAAVPRPVLGQASYPISGTLTSLTSTPGMGGPTVPTWSHRKGSAMVAAAHVSVRP